MSERSQLAAKNVVVSVGTQLIGWVLTFAVTLFLPRYVGSVGLGEMAAAGAFVAVFGVVVPLGTSAVLTRMVARDRTRTGELLAAGFTLRTPFALIVASLIVVIGQFCGYSALGRSLILVYAIQMVLFDANDVLGSVLQGQEKIARQSTNVLIGKVLSSALTIVLIALHQSITAIACVGLVTGVLLLVANMAAFRAYAPELRVPKRAQVLGLAQAGLPFLGWGVFQTLYGQTDPLVLKIVANNAAVGWYAAAFRLIGTTLFFPTAIASALLPSLSALFAENAMEEFHSLARKFVEICLLMAMPVFVVFISVPQELIKFLHYPASFAGSIPVLRVAGAGCLLYFIAVALGSVLIASDRQSTLLRASVVGASVGIPACFAASWLTGHFSSVYWGGHNAAVGAMTSDVLLEAILISFYLRASPPGTYGRQTLFYALRIIGATVPMGLILLTPIGSHLGLWKLAPAIAAYVAACFGFGVIDLKYLSTLKRAAARGQAAD